MKMHYKKILAFSLAEIMIAMLILSIITAATIGVVKMQNTTISKFMTYAAFTNLKQGVGQLIAEGCSATDISSAYCTIAKQLPVKGHSTAGARSLCDRLLDAFNTVGTATNGCNAATTSANFSNTYLNFTTTNGQRFFNLGPDPTAGQYTVYIDIDGTRRSGVLDTDVVSFAVYSDGTVYPLGIAATSTDYLSASVKTGTTIVDFGVSYKEALCEATGAYLPLGCGAYSQAAACTGGICEVILNKPKY